MNYNARLGLIFFCVYLALYLGFVLVNTFSPQTMETTPIAGVNLSVSYGFLLIVAAFVLAMIYGLLCRSGNEPKDREGSR